MRESRSRYSAVSIILHWTIAALVLANFFVGGAFEEAHEDGGGVGIFAWHKSIGVTIVLLTVIRLVWRLTHPWPQLPESMALWERLLARFTHAGFYVLLLAIPLFGWAAASAEGMPATALWGFIPWPNLPLPQTHDLAETLGGIHTTLVKGVYVLLFLHVAGALKHHFFDRDEVLHRMLPLIPVRRR